MTRLNGIVALLITLMVLISPSAAIAQTVSELQASQETEIDGLRLLEPASGITFGYVEQDTNPGGGKYLCGATSASTARAAATMMAGALAKIPAHSLAKAELKYIILCGRLLASSQLIGGIPVPPLNLLMLNIGENAALTSYHEHMMFHEFYHLMEYRFNTFNDAEWQSRFGGGYTNSYAGRLKKSPIGSGKPGFLNAYSETFPHEERAELFTFLLLNAHEVTAHIETTADTALKEKILYLVDKCNLLLGFALPFSAK